MRERCRALLLYCPAGYSLPILSIVRNSLQLSLPYSSRHSALKKRCGRIATAPHSPFKIPLKNNHLLQINTCHTNDNGYHLHHKTDQSPNLIFCSIEITRYPRFMPTLSQYHVKYFNTERIGIPFGNMIFGE